MKLDIQKFAVTVTTTFNESNISIPNNTSSLTINIYFSPNNSSTWFSSATLYCTCNGVSQNKKVSLSKGGSVNTSFTFNNIKHNNDGSKTVSWSWSCSTGTSVLGDLSRSGTRTLTKIARASGLSFNPNPAQLGSAVTITLTKYIQGTTDTLTWQLGSASGTIGTTTEDSFIWTPPIDLAEQITNSTSGTCKISCTSYNGSTLIGTSTANLTLQVPSSVVPSVSIGTITEANENMALLNWGVFVQNKSQLNIPITASGIYGSNVVSVVTTINGNNFNGLNIITPVLITSGTSTITTTVTDSRGRTATTATTYSVEPYTNPTITSVEAQRCLQDGTIDEDGTYLLYTFVGSISSVSNHNSKLFQIGYKKATDENYTFVTISNTYSVNENDSVSSFTISPDYAYDIVFQAIDSFMTTAIGRELTVGFDLMNFNASGKAMAIGKVSEASANEELLEIDLPTNFTQDITGTNASFNSLNVDGKDIIDRIKDYKVLWQGSPLYVIDTHTIPLSDLVSNQKNGIVLVWQAYSSGQALNYYFNYTFIPKFHTAIHNGGGLVCWLSNSNGSSVATKYVYVSDNQIVGNASNGTGRTNQANSGIYTNNNSWVLTAVLGV